MERPSRTTAGGCAGKGLDKGPQKSVLVGLVSPFLNSPTPEEEGVGGESSKQSRTGGCPSPVTPPPHTQRNSRVCPQLPLVAKLCAADSPCQYARAAPSRRLSRKGERSTLTTPAQPSPSGTWGNADQIPTKPRSGSAPHVSGGKLSPGRESLRGLGRDSQRLRPHAARPRLRARSPGARSTA